jgi:uncharacterized protein YndB with AHSA1/START domain
MTTLSRHIDAPLEHVFSFFDDPSNTIEFNEHAVQFDSVDVQPDGRRTVDVVMGAGSRQWMQTVEQVLRDPPRRLITSGSTWSTDRGHHLLTVTTDRRFSAEGDGTRVDVIIHSRLHQPLRRPVQAIVNWLQRGATQAEFERQLGLIAKRIEERHRS